jgi:hypothetical protein
MYNCQCSIEELGLLDSPTEENIETAKSRLEGAPTRGSSSIVEL